MIIYKRINLKRKSKRIYLQLAPQFLVMNPSNASFYFEDRKRRKSTYTTYMGVIFRAVNMQEEEIKRNSTLRNKS